jgi:hypothetical protein
VGHQSGWLRGQMSTLRLIPTYGFVTYGSVGYAETVTLTSPRPTAPASRPRVGAVVRRVAGALASPLVPADYLDLFDPLRSGADLRGRVVSVTPEGADAVTTTIRPGKGWRGHIPGQYIRIGVDIDGVRQWRAYSLTHDARRTDGLITITTKAIPDGKVSGFLAAGGLTPGTLVHLDQATGDFTLPRVAPTKVLFVTAGSGITPVLGMLRNHLGRPPGRHPRPHLPVGKHRALRHRTPVVCRALGRAPGIPPRGAPRRHRRLHRPDPRPGRPRARLARARGVGVRADGPARLCRIPLGDRGNSPISSTSSASARPSSSDR